MFVGPNKLAYTSSSETLVLFDVFENGSLYCFSYTYPLQSIQEKKGNNFFRKKVKKEKYCHKWSTLYKTS